MIVGCVYLYDCVYVCIHDDNYCIVVSFNYDDGYECSLAPLLIIVV